MIINDDKFIFHNRAARLFAVKQNETVEKLMKHKMVIEVIQN